MRIASSECNKKRNDANVFPGVYFYYRRRFGARRAGCTRIFLAGGEGVGQGTRGVSLHNITRRASKSEIRIYARNFSHKSVAQFF